MNFLRRVLKMINAFFLRSCILELHIIFIISACLPIPHRSYKAPRISGIIYSGDAPLKQTEVYLSTARDGKCNSSDDMMAMTTDLGQFEIGPIRKFELFVFLIGDPLAYWIMCVDHDNVRQIIMSQNGIGIAPMVLKVKCNVQNQDKYQKEKFIKEFRHMQGDCVVLKP